MSLDTKKYSTSSEQKSFSTKQGIGEYFLDLAHMHPICPLSLSHARMFLLADVWARWQRQKGKSVRFPICMHYSGRTVYQISEVAKLWGSDKENEINEERFTPGLFIDFYQVSKSDYKEFSSPIFILDYFSSRILGDLKVLQVSCDYDEYFNTQDERYHEFVRFVINLYTEKKIIIPSTSHPGKALDYSGRWKKDALRSLNETKFSPESSLRMVRDSMLKLDNDWSYERELSIGTQIEGSVVDPMFDSELLSMFNAIFPVIKGVDPKLVAETYRELFGNISRPFRDDSLARIIPDHLSLVPVDTFFLESHLQNWAAKKIFSETLLLNPSLMTKEYFFIGSIVINGKNVSPSRRRGETLSQLIQSAGPIVARLALLYTFGNPVSDHEWPPWLVTSMRQKSYRFVKFFRLLQKRSVTNNYHQISMLLEERGGEINSLIETKQMKKVIGILFDKIPCEVYQLTERSQGEEEKQPDRQSRVSINNFFLGYLNVICPPIIELLNE